LFSTSLRFGNAGVLTIGREDVSGVKVNSAKVVVIGNEKGGSGKTTVTMHMAIGLLRRGVAVGTVDLDSHQQSLSRYLDNRMMWSEDNGVPLVLPEHRLIAPSLQDSRSAAQQEDLERLRDGLAALGRQCEIVLLDCPAGDGSLSRAAHSLADVLVTPINDSFIDLDPLLQFRPGSFQVLALGAYFRMLWEIRNERRRFGQSAFDWVVLRNRLSGLADQNKRNLAHVLERVAPIMRFLLTEGLGERIIFRQLFQQGLTLFDIDEPKTAILPTHSHEAARKELSVLLDILEEDDGASDREVNILGDEASSDLNMDNGSDS
jgi:chromosome partitioning protein